MIMVTSSTLFLLASMFFQQVVGSVTATWSWTNATGGPDEYEVQVTLDAGQTWVKPPGLPGPMYVPHDPDGSSHADLVDIFGVYQVRVRATNTAHTYWGPWSDPSLEFRTYGKPGVAKSIAVIITNP